jgi:hypothetical protein
VVDLGLSMVLVVDVAVGGLGDVFLVKTVLVIVDVVAAPS